MILYATLGLCALGAAALVYRYDLYDREPKVALAVAVGLGALAMALAGRVEVATFSLLEEPSFFVVAAVASLEEEALKVLVVVLFAVFARRIFNDPMDGIIYGSMAGLGAALEEGVAVLGSGPPGAMFLPPEELVLGAALMLVGMLLYGRLVIVASSWSQRVFSPGTVRRLGGWPGR